MNFWTMIQPWLAQAARDGLRVAGTWLLTHGFITNGAGVEAFIGAGMTLAGLVWGWWITVGANQMAALLKKLTAKTTTADAVATAKAAPPAIAAVKPVIMLALALSALLAISGGEARAQQPKPIQITGDIAKDTKANFGSKSGGLGGPFTCDVSLFTKLTPENVVNSIKNCVGDVVAGVARPLADDLQDSLSSAKTANDGTAVACYTPALALASAAQGTAAVPAVKDSTGNITTPEVAAKPPGPILIFQKYREFVTAGGPSNCKTMVQSTVSGTLGSAL